jgi:PDZ domain-containing protein
MVSSLIDTQHATLPPTPPADPVAVRPPARVHRWWAVPLAVVAAAVPAAVALAAFLPAELVASKAVPDPDDPERTIGVDAPYAIVPASAEAVAGRLAFGALEGFATVDEEREGDFFFVTISEPQQSLLSHWVGLAEPEIQPLTYEEKYGTSTPAQQRSVSRRLMSTSEQIAQFVALQAVGFEDVELVPGEVVVEQILCLEDDGSSCTRWAPADDVLDPGDLLLKAEGQELDTVDDLVGALEDNAPGDRIELEIQRGEEPPETVEVELIDAPGDLLLKAEGQELDTVDDLVGALEDNAPGDRIELEIQRGEEPPETVEVELIDAPGDPGRTIVGFVPFDTASVRLPFELDIDTGSIGGPSAGLAFTLTLIDELSEGNLTGGEDIAVTGTIDLEGEVGAIGGLPQKVSAVRQVGVDHFLVPASQSEASMELAREVAGDDVELIPVATLDESLAALARLGGDPITPYSANAD